MAAAAVALASAPAASEIELLRELNGDIWQPFPPDIRRHRGRASFLYLLPGDPDPRRWP